MSNQEKKNLPTEILLLPHAQSHSEFLLRSPVCAQPVRRSVNEKGLIYFKSGLTRSHCEVQGLLKSSHVILSY